MNNTINKTFINICKNKWVNLSIVWFVLGAFLIYLIPLESGDQLHYLSVAWEMYKNHLYLSTYSGGRLDLEKTPLLYWLLVTGWRIFGVSNIFPKILMQIIGLFDLMLTAWLTQQLFGKIRIAWISIFLLLTSFYWAFFFQTIRFEGLVVFFGMLFLNLVVKATLSKNNFYWVLSAVVFGLCTFSKGPVSFLYYLPIVFCLPLFLKVENIKVWCLKLTIVMLSGLIIPLFWILLVYFQHGTAAVNYLLFGQVTRRVGIAFNGFFMPIITLVANLLPWTLIYIFYLIKGQKKLEKEIIIFWGVLLIQILFFSFVVGKKSSHYLVPFAPIMSIIMAKFLYDKISDKQFWFLGAIFLLIFSIHQIHLRTTKYRSLEPFAQEISKIAKLGIPLVQFSPRPGDQNFEFLARLDHDLIILTTREDQSSWLKDHPDGWIINAYQKLPDQCNFSYQSETSNHWVLTLSTAKSYLDCKL